MRLGPAAAAGALVLLPQAAFAHAPVPGVGAFWNGVIHPLIVPLHLLALAGAGIALGQNAPEASRLALPACAASLAAGLALAGPGGTPPAVLLAITAAAGCLAALGRGATVAVVGVAAAAGLAVGLDSPPDAVPGEVRFSAAGTLAGGLLVAVLCGGLAAAAAAGWRRIAVRTAGSWIAAASLIGLAFALSSGAAQS